MQVCWGRREEGGAEGRGGGRGRREGRGRGRREEHHDVPCLQAELGQLGVTSEMGEGGRERGRGEKGGGGEGKGVDSNVWEEQLQQELQDLELQV